MTRRQLRIWSDVPLDADQPQDKKAILERLKRVHIPLPYQTARLNKILQMSTDPDVVVYVSELRDFIQNLKDNLERGRGLYLLGPPGSGKSSCSAIVCKAAVLHTPSVLFASIEDVVRASMKELVFDEDEGVLLEDRMRSVDLLVIDDLGREYSKDYGKSQVEGLLRHRYDGFLSTIITSNIHYFEVDGKSIGTEYGETVESLIHERFRLVAVRGVNWRKEAEAKNMAPIKPESLLTREEIDVLLRKETP